MRVELTLQDLTRVRLAAAADPMGELTASLQLLQRRDNGPQAGLGRWRHRVWQGLGESAPVLLWLCRPDAPVPEFLLPAAGRYELESGLAAVLKTDSVSLKTDLRHMLLDGGLPYWAAGLPDGDTTVLPRLVQALRDYFDLALAPAWETARAQVEADLETRTQLLLRGGVDALLASLRPAIRWLSPALEADDAIAGGWCSHGTGLLVVPTFFSTCPALIPASAGGTARLHYPPGRHLAPAAAPRRHQPAAALADLLGPTRAAALAILAVACSTTELAARLGVTPSAVSKHTTVLRQAGLILTHRDRNTVLHSLTPLGNALLES